MSGPVLVIAGNHQQFQYWRHFMNHPVSWRYVFDATQLMGYSRDTTVLLVGEWWRSPVNLDYVYARFRNVQRLGWTSGDRSSPNTTWLNRMMPLLPFKERWKR